MLNLLHHSHSGRVRPHEFTSYIPLALLLLTVGLALVIGTVYAQSPGPEAGSVGLTGAVPGKAPTTAATIDTPTNQQRFSSTPIAVSGTCPANTLVEIFKNDIFAGSATCTEDGTYSLEIDLLIGRNELIARVYDALNQEGPESNTVVVFYDALPLQGAPLSPLDFGAEQMVLNTDTVFRGSFPGEELNVPISIIGGTSPYAINVQWGDSNNKVISRDDNLSFNATHTYKQAGTYPISLQATDTLGRVAFLTVAAIVNGQPSEIASDLQDGSNLNKLLVLWPLYTASAAILISFWLGERREKRVLVSHGVSPPPPPQKPQSPDQPS